ncbi:MAG TPA: hypothetical protein VK081_10160 [Planctomycetota bacterium]|nr:hypothetical protein [Planctomycetota bacterium]
MTALRLQLAALVLVAFAYRIVLAALTPVPSEDGASYLWMAQAFAAGDFRAPLGEVFPPLLPLAIAPLIALPVPCALCLPHGTGDPAELAFFAGQCLLAALGALSVLPIARLAAVVSDGAPRMVLAAGVLAALPGLPARFCAEIYTEPAFALLVACAALAGLRGAFWRCGLLAGAAFWLRPEALLLPVAFCLSGTARAWRSLVPAGAAVLALAAWRHAAGHGFDLLPKLAFNWGKANAGAADWLAAAARDLLALPPAWLEAFGGAGVLALGGLVVARRNAAARPLLLALLLGVLVVIAFAVRRRFLVAWWPLLVPLAVVALARLPQRWHLPLVALAAALGVAVGLRTTDSNRIAERDVARFVVGRLRPGEDFFTELPRVRLYAGRRPLPPRHLRADEIVAHARAPEVRYLVLLSGRATTPAVCAALPEFRPLALPGPLAGLAAARGLEVRAR